MEAHYTVAVYKKVAYSHNIEGCNVHQRFPNIKVKEKAKCLDWHA